MRCRLGWRVMGIPNGICKRKSRGTEGLTSCCIKLESCCRWRTALQRSGDSSELLPLSEALPDFVLPHPNVSTTSDLWHVRGCFHLLRFSHKSQQAKPHSGSTLGGGSF